MSRRREVVILEVTHRVAFVLDADTTVQMDAVGYAMTHLPELGLMEHAHLVGGRVAAIQSEDAHTWNGDLPTIVERFGTVYRQGGEEA